MRTFARALAHEQRRQDLADGGERAGGEVREWQRRQPGRGVGEQPGPADVVEVVAGALLVPSAEAEAGDGAVDGRPGRVLRPDAEACGHAGPEALDDDVGAPDERLPSAGSALRSHETDSLPALSASCHAGAVERMGSPSGGSRRTTRAPSSSSSLVA